MIYNANYVLNETVDEIFFRSLTESYYTEFCVNCIPLSFILQCLQNRRLFLNHTGPKYNYYSFNVDAQGQKSCNHLMKSMRSGVIQRW